MIKPEFEYIGELNVLLDAAMVVGETAHGNRRIVPIIGGTVRGPQLNGEIIKAGADWQVIRQDGCTELDAHYQFKTDDGVLIYLHNVGVRVASPEITTRIAKGEQVDSTQYYFRAAPKFEAPLQSKYAFLNDGIFICTAERLPNSVRAWIWKLL